MDELRTERVRQRLQGGLGVAVAEAIAAGRLPPEMQRAVAKANLKAMVEPGARMTIEGVRGPTPIAALEAIVQFVGRPPLLVHEDRVQIEPLPDFPMGTAEAIKRIEGTVRSVGRIEFINHYQAWGGTGWVVERPNSRSALVVTNRHVAAVVARNRADGRAVFMRSPSGAPYGAAINFSEEVGEAHGTSITAPMAKVEYLADLAAADVALLRVEIAGFDLPDPLDLSHRGAQRDQLVAVIGYPAYDSRNSHDDQDRYFRGLYDVKRLAPGRILQPGGSALQLSHDCTTLGGNSGSPVISLDDGRVLGLHFSGRYGVANAAVDASTLRAVLSGVRPIAVRLSQVAEEQADGHHTVADLKDREGFNTVFLGPSLATPWPLLPAHLASDLAVPSDDPPEPNELRYTHFGVKYSGSRRLPLLTAVNIDGERSIRLKRKPDRWFSDPRIPRDIQLTGRNFTDPEIDRGHMVRREDPNWAPVDQPEIARQADQDTFHYVNAAAQHLTLNRGKTLWQGLENYVLNSARVHGFRAAVFTGPVLRADDDEESDPIIDGAVIPLEFWKLVVAAREGGGLHATAYLLSQGQLIRRLMERRGRSEALEGFELGAYRTFQVRIADLAEATGYDLSVYVGADPLEHVEAAGEAILSREPVFLPLETEDDLRL